MTTKSELREWRRQCLDEIGQVPEDVMESLRWVVPGAPDKALRAVALYDPEVVRAVRYWTRKLHRYDRLLGRK